MSAECDRCGLRPQGKQGKEAALLAKDFDHIRDNAAVADMAENNGIYVSKGTDGETFMPVSNKYPTLRWHQLLSIVEPNFNKTDKCKELAEEFLMLLHTEMKLLISISIPRKHRIPYRRQDQEPFTCCCQCLVG
jgi:hypothetical protein